MPQYQQKTITKIEQQSKNKKRYSLYINEQFHVGISEDILVRHGLRKGMILTSDDLKKIVYDEEQNKANSYALRLLSSRSRSEKELINKMTEKEYNKETIKNTIIFLKEHKYIDDEAFASDYFNSKIKTQKFGKMKIKQDLFQKGISKDIITNTMEELSSWEQEYETALEISIKKIETTYRNDDKKSQYRKLGAFLQRRGFEYDVITKVLNKIL